MLHKVSLIYNWFIWATTFFWPDIPFIMRIRGFLYSPFLMECGKNFQVASTARINGSTRLKVGNNVFLAMNTIILANAPIEIEDEVMIGIGSSIISGNHVNVNGSYRFGKCKPGPISIGRGTWICANVVITANSKIPDGCCVAANSIVVGSLDKSGVYGGLPARLL